MDNRKRKINVLVLIKACLTGHMLSQVPNQLLNSRSKRIPFPSPKDGKNMSFQVPNQRLDNFIENNSVITNSKSDWANEVIELILDPKKPFLNSKCPVTCNI
jgi:hypothetical protein